jgi:hypothetical protein
MGGVRLLVRAEDAEQAVKSLRGPVDVLVIDHVEKPTED